MIQASSAPDPKDRASEKRDWEELVNHLPALIAFWDRELHNVMANSAYLDWLGITPEEVRGQHMRDVLGPSVYAASQPYIEAVLAGRPQHFARSQTTRAGALGHTLVDYIPEVVGGQVTGFYALVTDVTTETELRDDLTEAQALAELGSYTYRPSTGEVAFSPELLRIMGRDPRGPSPSLESYLEQVHPEDLPRVEDTRVRADQGHAYEVDYRILRSDGEERHLRSRTRQVLDEDGRVTLLRGVMLDETERLQTAAALRDANTLLADLIGILGHDLRQPLAVLRGYLEETDDTWETTADDHRRALVRTALRASSRMDELLTDILAMAKLDRGQLDPQPATLDVGDLLENLLGQSPLECRVESEPDLSLYADPVHVRHVLMNLLSNAGRYGQPPYVVRAFSQDEDAVISVSDHGEGVPSAFVPRLFERFTRAPTGVATTVAGTGFGLHIVRSLVLANGGTVTYRPHEPTGSSFDVTLPRS